MSDNTQTVATHTAGPWALTEDGHIVGADGARVGEYHGNPRDVYAEAARVRADRALMTAAPEMLAALQGLLKHYVDLANCGDCGNWDPEQEPVVMAARAAIAKAEGRQ